MLKPVSLVGLVGRLAVSHKVPLGPLLLTYLILGNFILILVSIEYVEESMSWEGCVGEHLK